MGSGGPDGAVVGPASASERSDGSLAALGADSAVVSQEVATLVEGLRRHPPPRRVGVRVRSIADRAFAEEGKLAPVADVSSSSDDDQDEDEGEGEGDDEGEVRRVLVGAAGSSSQGSSSSSASGSSRVSGIMGAFNRVGNGTMQSLTSFSANVLRQSFRIAESSMSGALGTSGTEPGSAATAAEVGRKAVDSLFDSLFAEAVGGAGPGLEAVRTTVRLAAAPSLTVAGGGRSARSSWPSVSDTVSVHSFCADSLARGQIGSTVHVLEDWVDSFLPDESEATLSLSFRRFSGSVRGSADGAATSGSLTPSASPLAGARPGTTAPPAAPPRRPDPGSSTPRLGSLPGASMLGFGVRSAETGVAGTPSLKPVTPFLGGGRDLGIAVPSFSLGAAAPDGRSLRDEGSAGASEPSTVDAGAGASPLAFEVLVASLCTFYALVRLEGSREVAPWNAEDLRTYLARYGSRVHLDALLSALLQRECSELTSRDLARGHRSAGSASIRAVPSLTDALWDAGATPTDRHASVIAAVLGESTRRAWTRDFANSLDTIARDAARAESEPALPTSSALSTPAAAATAGLSRPLRSQPLLRSRSGPVTAESMWTDLIASVESFDGSEGGLGWARALASSGLRAPGLLPSKVLPLIAVLRGLPGWIAASPSLVWLVRLSQLMVPAACPLPAWLARALVTADGAGFPWRVVDHLAPWILHRPLLRAQLTAPLALQPNASQRVLSGTGLLVERARLLLEPRVASRLERGVLPPDEASAAASAAMESVFGALRSPGAASALSLSHAPVEGVKAAGLRGSATVATALDVGGQRGVGEGGETSETKGESGSEDGDDREVVVVGGQGRRDDHEDANDDAEEDNEDEEVEDEEDEDEEDEEENESVDVVGDLVAVPHRGRHRHERVRAGRAGRTIPSGSVSASSSSGASTVRTSSTSPAPSTSSVRSRRPTPRWGGGAPSVAATTPPSQPTSSGGILLAPRGSPSSSSEVPFPGVETDVVASVGLACVVPPAGAAWNGVPIPGSFVQPAWDRTTSILWRGLIVHAEELASPLGELLSVLWDAAEWRTLLAVVLRQFLLESRRMSPATMQSLAVATALAVHCESLEPLRFLLLAVQRKRGMSLPVGEDVVEEVAFILGCTHAELLRRARSRRTESGREQRSLQARSQSRSRSHLGLPVVDAGTVLQQLVRVFPPLVLVGAFAHPMASAFVHACPRGLVQYLVESFRLRRVAEDRLQGVGFAIAATQAAAPGAHHAQSRATLIAGTDLAHPTGAMPWEGPVVDELSRMELRVHELLDTVELELEHRARHYGGRRW